MAQTPTDDSSSNDSLEDRIRRGEDLFSSGAVAPAIDYFKGLLDEYGPSAVVHNNLGVAYWQQGQIADALTHFVAALETDRDHRESYLNVIQVLQSLHRTDEAAALAGSYLSRHPEDMEIRRLIDGPLPWDASAQGDSAISGVPAQQHDLSVADTSAVPQRPRRVAVFAVEPEKSAFAQLRLLGAFSELSDEFDVLWANRSKGTTARFSTDLIDTCDLIVVQRLFPGRDTRAICARIVQSGKPVLYETDDNPLDVPAAHPHRDTLEAAAPYIVEFMSYADRVTVSSQRLADRLAPYHDAITVLPNSIDTNVWPMETTDRAGYRSNETVTIGYAGTPTHGEDLAIVEGALRRVMDKYGERVRMVFFGIMPGGLGGYPGVELRDFQTDYADYAKALRESGIDIAIAPLADNEFNQCKSDIKWLEYSACGFAGAYSDTSAYRDSIEDGCTGLLVENTEAAWFDALDRLVCDPDLRERLGQTAREHVFKTRGMDAARDAYRSIYRNAVVEGKRGDVSRVPVSADYEIWKRRHRLTTADRALWAERSQRFASDTSVELVVNGVACSEEALGQTLESLANQIGGKISITVVGEGARPPIVHQYPCRWISATGAAIDSINQAIVGSDGGWVGFLQAGDRLADEALAVCTSYLGLNPGWHVMYTDEDFLTVHGHRCSPLFKPDINPDLLRSTFYTGNLCLVRRASLLAAGGVIGMGAAGLADLVLKVLERFGEQGVGHVPRVLYHRAVGNASTDSGYQDTLTYPQVVKAHLDRLGLQASVSDGPIGDTCSVRYHSGKHPLVSIIVPTRDRLELLENCVGSVLTKTAYPNYELIVMDNDSQEEATLEYLRNLEEREQQVRVIRYPHEYNFSAINNEAAREARGEFLVLLNNDTVVLQEDWLDRMMEHGQRTEVGIVGVRLLFMDQTLQHAGVVVGLSGVADHVSYRLDLNEPGYLCRAQLEQNFSAVTAACLLIRKDLYLEVGGLDEQDFRVLFNDVDLCLKVREAGYQVLWTPRVSLVHHESVSLGDGKKSKKSKRAGIESEGMISKWLPVLASDPAYNRNLSLSSRDWALETEVDVPWDPNFMDSHRVLGLGGGSEGVLEHRMRVPLSALSQSGRAQCSTVPTYADRIRVPSPVELVRARPDTVLAHNTVHDVHLSALRSYRRHTEAFLVFGQDDLMIELPRTNPFFNTVFRDIKRRLRSALESCHRLIVTTEPLAEAYRDYCDDIVVVPNYLPRSIWGDLRSRRRHGGKPRVGWAGAQQHAGDLAVLRRVIKATADEVDWVFFGMSLHEFRRYRRELHPAVSFGAYPQTLACLDLDLAVAPLEQNRFNECKSNLRLLEYGALGWPVVCTNIEPYRDAPVCRVANNPKAWINAIRERVHDLDAAEQEGDRLRRWVLGGWLLEDHVEDWLSALSPSANQIGLKMSGTRRHDVRAKSTAARALGTGVAVE